MSSADGEERQVQRAAEGSVRGELSADEGAAGHRAAAEESREEQLPVEGEGRRPQQAAERDRPRVARHVAPAGTTPPPQVQGPISSWSEISFTKAARGR